MKTTQTTKILAIGTISPGFEQSQVFAVLPEEVRETDCVAVELTIDLRQLRQVVARRAGPTSECRAMRY